MRHQWSLLLSTKSTSIRWNELEGKWADMQQVVKGLWKYITQLKVSERCKRVWRSAALRLPAATALPPQRTCSGSWTLCRCLCWTSTGRSPSSPNIWSRDWSWWPVTWWRPASRGQVATVWISHTNTSYQRQFTTSSVCKLVSDLEEKSLWSINDGPRVEFK